LDQSSDPNNLNYSPNNTEYFTTICDGCKLCHPRDNYETIDRYNIPVETNKCGTQTCIIEECKKMNYGGYSFCIDHIHSYILNKIKFSIVELTTNYNNIKISKLFDMVCLIDFIKGIFKNVLPCDLYKEIVSYFNDYHYVLIQN